MTPSTAPALIGLGRLVTVLVAVLIDVLAAGLVVVLVVGFYVARPAAAAEADHPRRYASCMALVRQAPEQAFADALAWGDLGGGEAARHCTAAALMGMGQYGEAAKRFESLAHGTKAGAAFKARLLAQAAQARLLNGEAAAAEAILTAALGLKPLGIELMIDRAVVRAERNDYGAALEDLNRALKLDPRRADAFAFRASAYRYLDRLDLARADAEEALALDSNNPEALLERGNLRRLTGDDAGARRDWMRILVEQPATDAARAARANLEKMDVKTQ